MSGAQPAIGTDTGAVFTDWAQGLSDAVNPPPLPPGVPPAPPLTPAQKAAHQTAQTARAVATITENLLGALGLVQQAFDTGFAEWTAPFAKLFPALPAATLATPYLGVPHIHQHPPGIPLPGIGMILFGCHLATLINGMPAARAGDLGMAPTCTGFFPIFEIFTGSSNVFIGGARAARAADFCLACTDTGEAVGGPWEAVAQVAMTVLPAAAEIVADLEEEVEAEADDDAAAAEAKTLAAAMTAAQTANDLIRMAIGQLMGMDPGKPTIGFVLMGHPNVLIGGFPMINILDMVMMLLTKLHNRKPKPHSKLGKEEEKSSAGCKGRC